MDRETKYIVRCNGGDWKAGSLDEAYDLSGNFELKGYDTVISKIEPESNEEPIES